MGVPKPTCFEGMTIAAVRHLLVIVSLVLVSALVCCKPNQLNHDWLENQRLLTKQD